MDNFRNRVYRGILEKPYEAELQAIEQQQLLKRLWSQDATLLACEEHGTGHLKQGLEFLHLPERLPQLMANALRADAEAQSEGLTERLLISFGTVHHFCSAVLKVQADGRDTACVSLESCHPDAIRKAEERLTLPKTFVIFVNKSGYRLEDHALFLHFYQRLKTEAPGRPGRHFAAASDPSTYLAGMTREYNFRYLLELPRGIPGPFCATLFLGLFLVAVAKVDPEVLKVACRDMHRLYSGADSTTQNPACELGAFLSATAKSGRRFVQLLASPKLMPFAEALCPLVGGSLGQGTAGLFPITNTLSGTTESNEKASSFVVLRGPEETDRVMEQCISGFRTRGIPFLEMEVASPVDVLRLTYEWQIATVLSAARMGVCPFEVPERGAPLNLAADMLNGYTRQNDTLQRRPRIQEDGIQLFADGRTRHEVSQLNLSEGLRTFFQGRNEEAYLALHVFLDQEEEVRAYFESVREDLAEKLNLPVLLAWGPRALENYGYLQQEQAPRGLHVVITGDLQADLRIPGADYQYGQLYRALALAQFESLSSRNNLVLRLHLGRPLPQARAALRSVICQALKGIHS